MSDGYRHAFLDPIASGFLVTLMHSDGITLSIAMWRFDGSMRPVGQLLNIVHQYSGVTTIEQGR